jgi:hypothetical protein
LHLRSGLNRAEYTECGGMFWRFKEPLIEWAGG